MSLPVKIVLPIGAIGVAGVSGFGIYRGFIEPSTIKEKILSSRVNDFSRFLPIKDSYWEAVKSEYSKQGADNKPIENGSPVTSENLPTWCEKTINSYFYEQETSKFNSVLRWCYVNTNSFQEQAEKLNKTLYSDSGDDSAWKDAWDKTYKNFKSDEYWKIPEDNSNLNGSDKNQGGPALKKWCSEKLTTTMFSNGAQKTFAQFEKFCLKDKVS
ncbi:hypothetical protein MHC_02440 [Mycoplasma haemocanis str. Illinois]|uniref:Uncharacterized protein n=1 Tax=Mycoplasma haemocanis (strain Illinois) TaxID=1111676 RepID=H6N6T0_MYCHN|nr:hypothetical protein [Mycoplasma haemocanis]AEW45352.1 hypothetical protein MHC_02440 [Mycoplasma haemocanis str. Illinois]